MTSPGRTRIVADYPRSVINRLQGRSMVMTTRGVVASEHPLASQSAASVLGLGGSAVDAAIAANAVMGVVAPMMNGIGGDLFAIVYDAASGQIYGLNGSGHAPALWTREALARAGATSMPQRGIHSVTVPGAVAAWALLSERFGRVPLSAALSPAIQIANEGFPVPEIVAEEWRNAEPLLRANPEATRVFLPGNCVPSVGTVFRNPDLASTYQLLASQGREAFYSGEIAGRIVACSRDHGGALAAPDLAHYDAEWVTPLSTTYRGWTIYELPPNGQGVAVLMMLNLLEPLPIGSYGHNSVEALHALIEAKKLAYADMATHVCDPSFHPVRVEALLSKAYGITRAREIDPARANPGASPGTLPEKGSDTTYLAAVDRHGNMVSLIQSNFANFGSGLVPEGAGFALQNRGALFTLDPAHVNALEPRKRPLHTIIPGMMANDRTRIAFGIMGGWNQAQAHVQFVSNVVDHGMNLQAALEAARVTKLTFTGNDVIAESRIPETVLQALERRGHEIEREGGLSSLVGGGQSVARNDVTGVNYAASDPRKDGAAIPEPFPV